MARSFAAASSQYLEVSSAVLTSLPITMACWAYSTSIANSTSLIAIGTSSGSARYLLVMGGSVGGDPIIATHNDGTTNGSANSSSAYSANTWHHCCAVLVGTEDRRVYMDGGNKGTNGTLVATFTPDVTNIATRYNAGTRGAYHDGRIAHAAIWNIALSDAEVSSLYNNGIGADPRTIRPDALVAFWPLIDADGDQDWWRQYNLTANGSPTYAADPPVIMNHGIWVPYQIGPSSGSVSVTPAAASAVAKTVAPTVVLGSLSITPTARTAVASTSGPTVVLGSLAVTPAAASAIASTTAPTVVLGSTSVTPAACTAVVSTSGPTVVLGGVAITPAAASAVASTTDPTVVLGSTSVTPAAASAVAKTVDPVVSTGGVTVAPAAASAVASTSGPTVVLGSVSITPTAASAVASTSGPTIVFGSVVISPDPARAVCYTSVTVPSSAVYADLNIYHDAKWDLNIRHDAKWDLNIYTSNA